MVRVLRVLLQPVISLPFDAGHGAGVIDPVKWIAFAIDEKFAAVSRVQIQPKKNRGGAVVLQILCKRRCCRFGFRRADEIQNVGELTYLRGACRPFLIEKGERNWRIDIRRIGRCGNRQRNIFRMSLRNLSAARLFSTT
jgi:hypothetical protein